MENTKNAMESSNIKSLLTRIEDMMVDRKPAIPAIPPPQQHQQPQAGQHGVMDYDRVEKIAQFLLSQTKHRPKIGIICGTGLGGLADQLEDTDIFPYENIPDFPVSTVAGHKGCLVFGLLNGVPTVCMKGRFHPYEGYATSQCGMPVRVMKVIGVKTLVVTNAAGGLNPEFKVGDIMIIKDHINLPGLAGESPLRGPNDERFGPRFASMNNAYDPNLIKTVKQSVKELGMQGYIREGVYCMVSGPNYETIAENRMLRMFGADAVGMSTVHEVIMAHHCGIKCVGFSLITNKCVMDYECQEFPNHNEVIEIGLKRARDLEKLVSKVIENGELKV